MALSISPLSTTSVLVPAYIYPSPSAWAPLYTTIESNPTVSFYVIINPASGPGPDTFPDSNYATALAQLNTYGTPRVSTLGYVHTSYASRALSEVQADVATYYNWRTYSSADIALGGIFFDEAPANASEASVDYMHAAAQAVKDTWPTSAGNGQGFVVFNPGTVVQSQEYFEAADAVVVYEGAAETYTTAPLTGAQKAKNPRQQAVIVHSFEGESGQLAQLVNETVKAQAGPFFVTDAYEAWPSYLDTFVKDVAAANAEN